MVSQEVASRGQACILGCLVGDAAATPCHWVYDPSKLAEKIGSASPAFMSPPPNPFYTPLPGGLSCYGDQTLTLLRSLVSQKGFDVDHYAASLAETFGRTSVYEQEYVATDESWPALRKGLQFEKDYPVKGPWRHGSIKGFLTKYTVNQERFPNCGSDDKQIDCACKVAPLVALYAGDPQMYSHVEAAIRVTQNMDEAVGYGSAMAAILEPLVLGKAADVQQALDIALKEPKSSVAAESLRPLLSTYASMSLHDLGKEMKPAEAKFEFAGLS
eukprot:gnl/MRDRNA2_/MRDRNA2_189313_c0_seq1.p1 gnl/MRDRNA2_/MRDRNA2_189313_c0~~gnl/MRDRNA2_/MRDRNA2_189313_c0_seq1.p1  ORF type:complete len:272 (-),score=62.49 gnl/MRDRNA2_/MRDRNA2_189313_c0_seq1:367-1182(-)